MRYLLREKTIAKLQGELSRVARDDEDGNYSAELHSLLECIALGHPARDVETLAQDLCLTKMLEFDEIKPMKQLARL